MYSVGKFTDGVSVTQTLVVEGKLTANSFFVLPDEVSALIKQLQETQS